MAIQTLFEWHELIAKKQTGSSPVPQPTVLHVLFTFVSVDDKSPTVRNPAEQRQATERGRTGCLRALLMGSTTVERSFASKSGPEADVAPSRMFT